MTTEVSKVLRCHENCNSSSENEAKVWRLPHQKNELRHLVKHVGMSQSATPTTRNEATRHVEPPKVTTFAELTHRHGHTALTRPPADGCERKRNVERTHPQPPDRQSETGTFATHLGKKLIFGLLKK